MLYGYRSYGAIRVRTSESGSGRKRFEGRITFPASIEEKLVDPENPSMRINQLRTIVSTAVMTKESLNGREPVASLIHTASPPGAADPTARSCMVDWRARQDSNLLPQD